MVMVMDLLLFVQGGRIMAGLLPPFILPNISAASRPPSFSLFLYGGLHQHKT